MSPKVLIADDSGVMRKIIIRILKLIGVEDIVEAVDGEDALAKFTPGEYQLVLTDWNMPGKTGLDVIKGVREVDKDVCLIMITTEAEKRRVLAAIRAGVNDYLTKPFEASSLREKLEKHLGSQFALA